MVNRNKNTKKLRETTLTKFRMITNNKERVEKSWLVWADLENGWYGMSYLGIINGILTKFGYKYALVINHKNEIVGYDFIKIK